MIDGTIQFSAARKRLLRRRRVQIAAFILVGIVALIVDVWTAVRLYQNAPDGDAKIYSRVAVNVLEHHVFSTDEQPDASGQYKPSIIRLPGYPLFLAAVYAVAGSENYTAVRA